MKKWQIFFLVLLIVGTVIIIRQNHPASPPFQQEEGIVFGTVYHTTYQCDSSVHTMILNELNKVDASLSMFNPNSTISKINRGESSETDSLFRYVFVMSQEISKATNGDFDITVAPLVNAWGFGFKGGTLPDSAQVDSLKNFVGWEKVTLTADGKIEKSDERTIMDCSAVAKGFGVDQVASLFGRLDIQNYMIEIGGEVIAKGHNPKGEAWKIGINQPVEDSTSMNRDIQAVIKVTDCHMATSGNYRNYYTSDDGRKIAHTINPHSGYPIQQDILSSTVIAPTCAMADAFATAFMVMGLDKAKEILADHPDLKAYFIYDTGDGTHKTWKTDNIELVN